MNNVTFSLNYTNQVEFAKKCDQLNILLANKQQIEIIYDENEKAYHAVAMPKPTGLSTGLYWLISKIYKRKERRFAHISDIVVNFLETNLTKQQLTYDGDLLIRLIERWKNKPISNRLEALYDAYSPKPEQRKQEITNWYEQTKMFETQARQNASIIEQAAKEKAQKIINEAEKNCSYHIKREIEKANDLEINARNKALEIEIQASQKATNIEQAAKEKAQKIINEAEKNCSHHIERGFEKANDLEINARNKALEIEIQASQKAANIEQVAKEKAQKIINETEEKCSHRFDNEFEKINKLETDARRKALEIETEARNKAFNIEERALEYFRRIEKQCHQLLQNAYHGASKALCAQKLQDPTWDELRHDDADKDLTIFCSDGEIKAHTTILETKKSLFKTKLQTALGEGLDDEEIKKIDLKIYPKVIVGLMLDYLYTQTVSKCSIDLIISLYELADYLYFEKLEKHCIDLLYSIFYTDIRLSYGTFMLNRERLHKHSTIEHHFIWKVGMALWQNLLSSDGAKSLFDYIDQLHKCNKRNASYKALLGMALLKGYGTEKNEEKAYTYFKLSEPYAIAQFGLGYIHHHGLANQATDLNKAREYYQKIEIYPPALNGLALLQNDSWKFFKPARSGYAESQWNLFLKGFGREYLEKAAAQGLECAVNKLKELGGANEEKKDNEVNIQQNLEIQNNLD